MAGWLLLLNDRISTDDTLASLQAAPRPLGPVFILATASRWRPLTSGIPMSYRSERQRALREIWLEQEEHARARLVELTSALQDAAETVDSQFTWGDSAREAHRLARALNLGLIVFPVPAGRGLLSMWPASVARRLTQNAPCSVMLARVPTGTEKAVKSQSLQAA